MSPASPLLIAAGLLLLTAGAEVLVRGATRIAARLGIPPLVIGLTVVAFGTSSPEVAVSLEAARAGRPGLALGNVVGSNVVNVLLILGASALVAPLAVQRQLVRLDVPVMIGVSLLPLVLAMDGALGRGEGLGLLGLGVAYVGALAWLGLREGSGPPNRRAPAAAPPATGPAGAPISPAPGASPRRRWLRDVVLVVTGLVLLTGGSQGLVRGASDVARALGMGEVVIGLTLVAIGTSLPELATSFVATLRGERDLAVGNVVGSNVFNVLWVLGGAAAVAPLGLAVPRGVLTFDLPVMVAVAVLCLPIFITGWTIRRAEGALLLLYYALYLSYLLLHATGHEAQDVFGSVVLLVVVPLTALSAGYFWYRGRAAPAGASRDGKTA